MDLNELTKDQKIGLAMDKNTPPETLTLLASDEYFYVRYSVAQNPNTPPETLTLLASDDYWVRCGVASNPNTPPETLTILAKDEYSSVRWDVSRNPNTPQYVKDYVIARNFMDDYDKPA